MANNKVMILAIDGGGIRGIIPAYILTQFEKLTGKSCHQLFDIIGGTSTGGILTAGLTTPNTQVSNFIPFTAAELLTIYRTMGNRIFVKQHGVNCADYYADDGAGNGVEVFLQKVIGPNITLAAAQKAVVSVPGNRVMQMFTTGYIVNSYGNVVPQPVQGKDFGPVLFNWRDAVMQPGCNYRVWEAARATSAAPVYFPVAQVGGGSGNRSPMPEKWVVDGGVMSNNPAMWALSEVFRLGLTTSLSDITLISLGTGVYPGANGVGIHNNTGWSYDDNGNWDSVPWMKSLYDLEGYEADGTLISVIMESVQQVTNSQLSSFVASGLNYYRLEPNIIQSLSAMDDVSQTNINNLMARAASYVQNEGYAVFNEVVSILKGI